MAGYSSVLGYVKLIADENAWQFFSAFGVEDEEGVKELVVHSLDDVERGFADEGKHENIAIDTDGVLLTKVGKLILAVRVDDSDLVVGAVDDGGPEERILAGGHVLGLKTVVGALNDDGALADGTGAEHGDALAHEEGRARRRRQVAVEVVRVAHGGDGAQGAQGAGGAGGVRDGGRRRGRVGAVELERLHGTNERSGASDADARNSANKRSAA